MAYFFLLQKRPDSRSEDAYQKAVSAADGILGLSNGAA